MKTKNYLGKQDENRGIYAFCIVFAIFLVGVLILAALNGFSKSSLNKGITSIDKISNEIEKVFVSTSRFEMQDGKITLEGKITESLNESILSKLQDVKLVLKNADGNVYEYNVDYYISTKAIDFSTIDENSKVTTMDISNIESGEYFVFLKLKYNSANTELGYRERYYSLKNMTEVNEYTYNDFKISFGGSTRVQNYLMISDK